jgi:light-regulated signal transduction histidine kinase (bacteriophytochrome)
MNEYKKTEFLSAAVPADLTNCDREPIHIPSAIQPHGVLIAARSLDLRICYISENSKALLGFSPREALGRTLDSVLGSGPVAAIQSACLAKDRATVDPVTFRYPLRPVR